MKKLGILALALMSTVGIARPITAFANRNVIVNVKFDYEHKSSKAEGFSKHGLVGEIEAEKPITLLEYGDFTLDLVPSASAGLGISKIKISNPSIINGLQELNLKSRIYKGGVGVAAMGGYQFNDAYKFKAGVGTAVGLKVETVSDTVEQKIFKSASIISYVDVVTKGGVEYKNINLGLDLGARLKFYSNDKSIPGLSSTTVSPSFLLGLKAGYKF